MSDDQPIKVGQEVHITQGNYEEVVEVRSLSNGKYLYKTKGDKGDEDYQTRIWSDKHRAKSIEYTRFAVDLTMKYHSDQETADKVFTAIVEAWNGRDIEELLDEYSDEVDSLPGYDLEFILYALDWIMENEDVTFDGRSNNKQSEISEKLEEIAIENENNRGGSQLAIALFSGIMLGNHPVDELYDAGLL